jgi:oligopeptide/dipeptide ABC transporter ATP-binding protein
VLGATASREPLLDVQDLKTYFFTRSGVVKAVDGVSFTLHSGETLGIVGESGCGKSVTALSIMGLVPEPAGRIVGGRVLLAGEDLLTKSREQMQRLRGREICMILQDPMTSLNPAFSIGDQLLETLQLHRDAQRTRLRAKAVDLLQKLKIPSPEARLHSYPHQLSGGMRQRVVAAIALAGSPRVLIADEATTALDATIQYQYLLLLKDLQRETGLSMIFITHDFGIVAKVCDRVVVMYAGRVVESATVRDLFNLPSHPYTEALMRSVPDVDKDVDFLPSIDGQPPALDNLPPGCPFAPRCSYVMDRCLENYPPSVAVSREHQVACWRHT